MNHDHALDCRVGGHAGGSTRQRALPRNRQSTIDNRQSAFTLVEMLVVIAIIALLLAALLPAFAAVRNQARYAQANSQFRAIDTGLSMFRAETALGGGLPPSSSDDKDHRQKIVNPRAKNPDPRGSEPAAVRVAGAHLLVHALMGADGLGTPGFHDVSKPADGLWSNDTHDDDTAGKAGLYALDSSTGQVKFPRYGGAGYVDDKMKEVARSLYDLRDEGKVLNLGAPGDLSMSQRMFLDPWDHPILYYRANPVGLRMIGAKDKPGIFWQEDNGILTGSDGLYKDDGVDFGQGKVEGKNYHHDLAVAESPDPTLQNFIEVIQDDAQYDHSFARFILDPAIKARPTPVQKDSYLLISAGVDGRFGTDDDVTNWTRKTE